jgi:uncharacterized protein (DUF433 family)
MKNRQYNPLEVPSYGAEDAARYLHIPYQTLRYWISNNSDCGPVIRPARIQPPVLSFMDLLECWVLASLRHKEGLPMRNIRGAVETLREKYNSKHPLAEVEFETDGVYLFTRDALGLVNLSRRDQRALEGIMKAYLRRIDRDIEGIARRLYPFTRASYLRTKAHMDVPRVVMIDPSVSFGRPVLANSGISTAVLASRYRGGDSIAALAKEYDRKTTEIEEAVQWETGAIAA